jgi:hypothetical protein
MTSFPDDPSEPPRTGPPVPPSPADPPIWTPPSTDAPPWSSAPPPVPPAAPPAESLSPWTHIWTQPRAVMRQILDSDPHRLVHVLAMLSGIVEALGLRVPAPPVVPIGALLAFKVVMGAFGGVIVLYIFSGLVLMTGRWFGGRGSFTSVRAATAWSAVPAIWSALLFLPLVVYLGWEALNLDRTRLLGDPAGMALLVPTGMVLLVVAIWRFVIYLKCVGEAHGFSAWHSLGAAFIAGILFAIPCTIVVVAAVVLFGVALLSGH